MWILDWLPNWIWTLITFVGFVAFMATEFLSKIPFISMYLKGIRIGSIIALVIGLYMMGGAANQEKWEARVKELEAKVALAEEQSKTANVKIEKVYIDKIRKVKEVQLVVQEKIKEVEKRIDAECKVLPEAINILNEAAQMPGAQK